MLAWHKKGTKGRKKKHLSEREPQSKFQGLFGDLGSCCTEKDI